MNFIREIFVMKAVVVRVILLYNFLVPVVICKYVSEEVTSAYYDLSISSLPLNADSTNQEQAQTESGIPSNDVSTNIITIGNKYGQPYQCRVPTFVESSSVKEGQDSSSPPKLTNDEIRSALDGVLTGRCLTTPRESMGWWTYEFCYKGAITQYHMGEDNKPEGDTIYLGHFETEKDWSSEEAIEELSGKRKNTLYHRHWYTNGTECDLTNQFRRAEVRFICDRNFAFMNDAFLHSVEEPTSCEYLLTVHTATLCRFTSFHPVDKKPPPVKIECQPVLSGTEFDAYMQAKEAEEAKKREEAAKKKQEAEIKRKMEAERKRLEQEDDARKKLQQEQQLLGQRVLGIIGGKQEKLGQGPKFVDATGRGILGKTKADFLRLVNKKRTEKTAGIVGRENVEESIEYEYMTWWMKLELQGLALDEKVLDVERTIAAEGKVISDREWRGLNEFKRRTRRYALFTTFNNQLDDLIIGLTAVARLDTKGKTRTRNEMKQALTNALTVLIDELASVEAEMESRGEETDVAGLVAFKEMRDKAERRKMLADALQMDDVVKRKVTAGKIASPSDPNSPPASPDLATETNADVIQSSGQGSAQSMEATELQREVEDQLDQIMSEVRRELQEEDAFGDLDAQSLVKLQTEALKSLANTLSTLLNKLDDNGQKGTSSSSSKKDKGKKRVNAWQELLDNLGTDQNSGVADSKAVGEAMEDKESKSGRKKDGFRVRVSAIKLNGAEDSEKTIEGAGGTGKLEQKIAEKLQEAGLDTQGRPVQVKILTTMNLNDIGNTNSFHVLSDEEAEQFTNVVLSMFGGGTEQLAEHRRYQSLQDNYNFKLASDDGKDTGESKETRKTGPMQTIIAGGR